MCRPEVDAHLNLLRRDTNQTVKLLGTTLEMSFFVLFKIFKSMVVEFVLDFALCVHSQLTNISRKNAELGFKFSCFAFT